jgi:UDP-N-acetylmuramoyl-tripeptide--D-alanyl-D-alanine ligase
MRDMTLSEVVGPLQGKMLAGDCCFSSVTIDSRNLDGGELFVALPGEHADGHDFVTSAANEGAAAALVSHPGSYDLPSLQVEDTRIALGQLGKFNRSQFEGKVIGVTGSSGKTTVKNMLSSICSVMGATHATAGNFNNEIGLPLTLLGLMPVHKFAVIEMGASRPGDIAYLANLARPDIAVVLNAQEAHLEGFGSLDGVARTKGEIYQALPSEGVGIVNADSNYLPLWMDFLQRRRVISFGRSISADVRASDVCNNGALGCSFTLHCGDDTSAVNLSLPGEHNIDNALAACAAALAVGAGLADLVAGLESVAPVAGRLHAAENSRGTLVVDDSYNANPGSVKAAIDVLVATPGRHIFMFGEMGELGPDSEELHREIGRYAREKGVAELWLLGGAEMAAAGFGADARIYKNFEALPDLPEQFDGSDVVLVKGSRGSAMEHVVARLNSHEEGI